MLTANFSVGLAALLMAGARNGAKNRYGETTSVSRSTLFDSGSGIKQSMLVPSVLYDKTTYGVFFGSGTTPPTVHDYGMESAIVGGITIATPSDVSVTETDDYWEMSATYGISANSDTTISEVGLFIVYNKSSDITTSIMVDRTVLETPIVIPAGQSKQVTYTIRLNKPK